MNQGHKIRFCVLIAIGKKWVYKCIYYLKWGFCSIFALKSICKFWSNSFWGLIWNFWRVSSLIRFIVIYRFPDPSLVRNICFFLFVCPIKKLANIFYLYIFKNFKIMENLFHDMTTLQITINIIATWIMTFFKYTDKTEPYNKTCEIKFNFFHQIHSNLDITNLIIVNFAI